MSHKRHLWTARPPTWRRSTTSAAQEEHAAIKMVLVVDSSGSMRVSDQRALLNDAIARRLAGLSPADEVGLVVFDRDARLVHPLASAGDPRMGLGLAAWLVALRGRRRQPATSLNVEDSEMPEATLRDLAAFVAGA